MTSRPATVILACLTLLVLALSLPGSLRDAFDRGGIYLFSHAFLEDIPKRLTGPGRFRFVLQPLIATLLGIRSGLADARAGRPPYLYGVLFHRDLRSELVRTGFWVVVNLLLMGILLDAVFQWIILGVSHPGAALVVGPVLIVGPYSLARALEPRRRPAWAPVTGDTDMRTPLYPSLYQINTRVWLTELSQALGRPATLDDIPDAELDRAAEIGFDWIWLLARSGRPAAARGRQLCREPEPVLSASPVSRAGRPDGEAQ